MLLDSETTDGSDEMIKQEESKQAERSCCLTVTQVPEAVFTERNYKEIFEQVFRKYGEISVIYLKSFRRARVVYGNEEEASNAKDCLHGLYFEDEEMGVYFTQVPCYPQTTTQMSLQIPPPVKQFLISPPASPPVNWAQIPEATPVINHDLLQAVARLQPHEPYEAHIPSSQELGHPSIKIHWCDDDDERREHPLRTQPRHLVQTHKPPDSNAAVDQED